MAKNTRVRPGREREGEKQGEGKKAEEISSETCRAAIMRAHILCIQASAPVITPLPCRAPH